MTLNDRLRPDMMSLKATERSEGYPWASALWLLWRDMDKALLKKGCEPWFFPWFMLLLAVASSGCVAQRQIAGRYPDLRPGILWMETVARHAGETRDQRSPAMADAVVNAWARRGLPEAKHAARRKIVPPRIVLARLEAGYELDEANRFLMSLRPWNASGSEWDVRELWGWRKSIDDRLRLGHRGDYDFAQSVLITLLYRFGDRPDRLYPDTRRHLVDTLIMDRGPQPRRHAPRSLGLVPETENHLLMTESARYLANQWLRARGDGDPQYDNAQNALGPWLTRLLEQILAGGLYEFNSDPYHGYALQALLNLEAYADCERIAGLSRLILDAELWRYAFGSLDYRRSVPFRRNVRRAAHSDLTRDRLGHFAVVWTAPGPETLPAGLRQRVERSHFALDAAVAGYAPPALLAGRLRDGTPRDMFVRLGRGSRGSPEIHSAGPGFILSAGGVAPPRTREIVVRPIVLLLPDQTLDRSGLIRIPVGPRDVRHANRTGVYHRFACGDRPVTVPDRFVPETVSGGWRLYRPDPERPLRVAVYNADALGLFAVFPRPHQTGEALLDALRAVNQETDLQRRFVFPDTGKILEYDVDAPRTQWVMRKLNGQPLPRDYTAWSRFSAKPSR